MRRILVSLALVLILGLLLGGQVSATDVTVTASPSYISFSSAPTTWTLNGITGGGKIDENTTYYANPLGDTTPPSSTVVNGECQFTWTNDSTVNIVITCNWGAFTGGDATMTNGNTGSNGATTFGAYSWYSGMTYSSKVITKSSGSDSLYTTSTPGEDKYWGAEITTRTDTWTGSGDSTATLSITAVES